MLQESIKDTKVETEKFPMFCILLLTVMSTGPGNIVIHTEGRP